MKWLNKIIKNAIHEAEEELFSDIEEVSLDDLDRKLDDMLDPEPLDIPINLLIDGKPPKEITDDVMQKLVSLAQNEALKNDVERYLGRQFKELAITPEGKAANLIRGKIYGISEYYRMLLNYEFLAQEGIEQKTTEPDEAGVDPS